MATQKQIEQFKFIADNWNNFLNRVQFTQDNDEEQFATEYLDIENLIFLDEQDDEPIKIEENTINDDHELEPSLKEIPSTIPLHPDNLNDDKSIPSHWNTCHTWVQCDLCEFSCWNKKYLLKHFSRKHDLRKQFSCQSCNRIFRKR